ncbi:GAF domain-containing protein [Caldimonas tepidiphila]|uniref:GAF domain-containing protein n=1 Tax=Caldimonas tepidiphila TaxID=2315841 RepID=UPI000E5B1A94|nr:GAF domain-containing protein [Caldimonas tepidiphila]
MLTPPVLNDEIERLESLRNLLILDSPQEQRFDWLVRYAAEQFDMPIAAFSLIDDRRQWFKAKIGLEVNETPRDISFCGHAIANDEIFIVEDALDDERFFDNPLVTEGLKIRFYAGAAVKSPDGKRIGVLCVIDTKPRKLSSLQLQILNALRDLAASDFQTQPSAEG